MSSFKEYGSPFPDIELAQSDLLTYLFSNPENVPSSKNVYIDPLTQEKLTYVDVLHRTKCLAAGLRAIGVSDGDIVVIYSPNTNEYPIYCFGILGCTATVAPFSPTLTLDELHAHLVATKAKYVIAHSSLVGNARKAIRKTFVEKLI